MKTETLVIRITEQQKKLLVDEAAKKDIPVAQIIRELIKEHYTNEWIKKHTSTRIG